MPRSRVSLRAEFRRRSPAGTTFCGSRSTPSRRTPVTRPVHRLYVPRSDRNPKFGDAIKRSTVDGASEPTGSRRGADQTLGSNAAGGLMSYESTAEPVKIGYLMDFLLSDDFPQHYRDDLTIPFDMVFEKAMAEGIIDRRVEVIYGEVEGLPKGSVKAVIDAYQELVDE